MKAAGLLAIPIVITLGVGLRTWTRQAPQVQPVRASPNSKNSIGLSQKSFTIVKGAKTSFDVRATNSTKSPIHVGRIKSSCDCLSVNLPPDGVILPAHGDARVNIIFDFSKDKEYAGEFAPELQLLGRAEEDLGLVVVDVSVTR